MIGESDSESPSVWIRVLGIIGAVYIVMYCAIGLQRDDLFVTLSKSGGDGVHLHGRLAWLCFAGAMLFSIGLVCLLAPELGDGAFDIGARRRRFGPIMVLGLVCFVAAKFIADMS
jgi:hypothetical protein